MTIADRIKQQRELLHLSQEELARACGYADKTSISKIENSGDDITLKKIRRIASALGVTHSYLMGWEDENGDNTVHGDLIDAYLYNNRLKNYSREQIIKALDFYDRFNRLSPEKQAALQTLLEVPQTDV